METQFEKVPASVQEIPERGGETLQAARERARQAAQYADDTVREYPWVSLGVGFGVGLVVGTLLTLAASSRRYY